MALWNWTWKPLFNLFSGWALLGPQLQQERAFYASFAAYVISCFASRGRWRSTAGGSRSFLIRRGWHARFPGSWLSSSRAPPRMVSSALVACGVQLSLAFAPATPFVALDLVCGGTAWSPLQSCALTQIITLHTSPWCSVPESALWGWASSKPLAPSLSHAALKMPQPTAYIELY